jgi:hypothetical protein
MFYNRATDKSVSNAAEVPVPQSVLVSLDGSRFIVNGGGANAVPLQATAFDAETCKPVWASKGRVIGLTARGEAVLDEETQVSVIDMSTWRVVRTFPLRGDWTP